MGVRAAGLLAGLCLVAVVALQSWRVPASPSAAGLELDLRAVPSGEVGVAPAGRVLGGTALTPGGPDVRGRVRLTNRTAQAVAARPLLSGGDPEFDRLVELELTAAGREVFRGRLGDLRDDVSTSVPLRRGDTVPVAVRAWVPQGAGDAAVARAGRWTLTFSSAGAAR